MEDVPYSDPCSKMEKKVNKEYASKAVSVPFHRLFAFADSLDVVLMMTGSLGAILAGVPLPIITYFFGSVFDVFGQMEPTHKLLDKIAMVALKCVFIAAIAGFGFFCDGACWKSTAERQATRMRENYLKSLLNQDIAFFDTEISTGEMIEAISADIFVIREVIGEKVGKLMQLCTTFICGFIVAFMRGWRLTVVVVSTVPFIIAAGAIGSFLISKVSKKLRDSDAKAGHIVEQAIGAIRTVGNFEIFTGISGIFSCPRFQISVVGLKVQTLGHSLEVQALTSINIKSRKLRGASPRSLIRGASPHFYLYQVVVASFTGEKKALDACETALKRTYIVALQSGLATGFGAGLLLFCTFSIYAFTLWYGAYIIIHNGYSGGKVTTVMFAVLAGGGALGQAFPCLSAFTAGKVAAYRVFKVIESVPKMNRCNEKSFIPESMKGNIELRNVTFSYPARKDVIILDNFCLVIPLGKTAALVGESGSGKSTVVSLIERFYDPQVGSVLIDGVDVKNIQLKWLRQQIGLVSQEPVLFGASIKNNIGFGKHSATFEEIQTAARLANAEKFIENLPEGYETMVGDRGAQLSGGQKQRIAIARAILKNPRILLLDEATSALDTESERIVQEALEQVMLDRTTVVIAHRLTTVKNASFISVLSRGALVEQGTHTELMHKRNGAYFQLVSRQELQGKESKDSEDVTDESGDVSSHIISRELSSSTIEDVGLPHLQHPTDDIIREGRNSKHSSFRIVSNSVAPIEKEFTKSNGLLGFLKNLKRKDDQEKSSKLDQTSIFRLARLNKPEIPVLLLGFLAGAVNGTTLPLFGLLLANMINAFYKPPHQLKRDSAFWAGMFMILAVVALIVNPAQVFFFALTGNKLIHRLRLLAFRHVMRQEMAWFDEQESSSGVISIRLSTDAATVKGLVGDVLALMVQNLATITSGLCITFWSSWQLAFVLLGILSLLILLACAQQKLLKRFNVKVKTASARPVHVAIEALSNIRTIASFSAEEQVLKMHRDTCKEPLKSDIQLGVTDGLGLATLNFVLFTTYGFSFWVGAKLVALGITNSKDIFRVFFAFAVSAIGISESLQTIPDISKVKFSVSSLFSIIDRKSKIDPEDGSGETLDQMKGQIAFRNVYFKYPTRPQVQVLRDLCLSLEPGKSLALVGESGSGKSTVLSLLERFYDSDSGEILIDNIDIKTFQVRWLRQQIGFVGQEPFLFDETIRENIAYGNQGDVPEDQILSAAKISNAHNFISGLPDGYNTQVGERGIQLSGGQKQRISIARAIVKNPSILLLDEATSALDVESEHLVQEALNRVMVGRTTVVVAHRLSTVRDADSIAVIRGGRIVERGTHQELLYRPDSVYAALVKSAASLS
eukprot:Gb_36862 [translate_table: standard]